MGRRTGVGVGGFGFLGGVVIIRAALFGFSFFRGVRG